MELVDTVGLSPAAYGREGSTPFRGTTIKAVCMHPSNYMCWQGIKDRYSEYFDESILEVGSYNINGTVRDILEEGCDEYVGVDWRAGPGVDVVSLAHKMKFDKQFKAVISASMLEHDPYWDFSIRRMAECVRPDGIFVLTWGAANSPPHCLEEAPDGKFHSLKGDLVRSLVQELGLVIVEWVYDFSLHKVLGCTPNEVADFVDEDADGSEEICMIAFPVSKEVVYIDESIWADRVLP